MRKRRGSFRRLTLCPGGVGGVEPIGPSFVANRPPPAENGRPYRTGDTARNDVTGPALGLPLERADTLLPADLLHGGELVLLLLKPSAWFILLGSLGTLTLIAGCTAGLLVLRQWLGIMAFDAGQLLSLAFTLAGLRLIWQFFEWLSRSYVLTDRRILRVKGVLRVEVFQARLEHIQHIEMHFSLRERFFALGTIAFATSGSAYPEAYWVMLRHPIAVHKRILDAINRYGGHLRMN